ncbi:hypothetical protein PINS_up009166 [Pythium insidiosum]|nr:hypothetical protein PINS_up009166 [Pythium insidiosum]
MSRVRPADGGAHAHASDAPPPASDEMPSSPTADALPPPPATASAPAPTLDTGAGAASLTTDAKAVHPPTPAQTHHTHTHAEPTAADSNFNGVDELHERDPQSRPQRSRGWRVVDRVALLTQALNPRDDVIDIYHDTGEHVSRFMVHPNSKFRRIWDVITATCVLYVCIMVPLIIGFNYVDWGKRYVVDTIVDVYFIVDMVVTVRTGVYSNGEVIMDSRIVLRRYLRSWFIIDVISNFPLALFVDSSARKSVKIVKLQKLPKLLRIGRLLKYLREYAKYYNLALSFVAMIVGLHFFACLWASMFSNCYAPDNRPLCDNSEMPKMYVQSFHTIMLMFLGIAESTSYAGIANMVDPHQEAAADMYAMSITVFIVGTVFSSFFFGNVLALILSWDQQSAQFRNRMDVINAEMKYYELPEDLQHRVRRNYDYLWINQRAYSDMMLLNQPGISKTLRLNIALHLYKDLVKTVPFFAGSDARFLGKVCLALETAVYLPGDTIIYYDDIGKEMFIVRKGLVEIIIPDGDGESEKRIYLRDGNFFGETALVVDVRRTNTVRAVTICDLNVLSKHAFNEIVAEYPEFGERMKKTVIKRQLDNMNIQSPAEKMKVQQQLNLIVEKSLKERRMSVSLRAIYKAKKLGDRLKEIADRAAQANNARRLTRKLSRIGAPSRIAASTQSSDRAHDLIGHVPLRAKPLALSSISQTSSSRSVAGQAPPPLLHQGTSSLQRITQLDAVSRKLSKAELTMDLIPSALAEITTMVNQIKRTTDRLSRRIHQRSDASSDDDDLDMEGWSELDQDISLHTAETTALTTGIPPLPEEHEDEIARRESRSTIALPPSLLQQRKASHLPG